MKFPIFSLLIYTCLLTQPLASYAQALKIQHDLVVVKDGSGNYRYIQDAIDANFKKKPFKHGRLKGFFLKNTSF